MVNLTFTHSGSDDDYEEDSSEEGGEGPFNMVTETYIPEEDYEDYDLQIYQQFKCIKVNTCVKFNKKVKHIKAPILPTEPVFLLELVGEGLVLGVNMGRGGEVGEECVHAQ